MPKFAYEYLDQAGRRASATEEAESAESLVQSLVRRGLQPIRVRRVRTLQTILGERRKKGLGYEDLLYFTKELSDLLNAGVELERALRILEDAADKEEAKALVSELRAAIQGGSTLSEALSAHPETFKPLYVNMVRVGELGGVLPQVLSRLDGFLERSREIRRFIVSSSIYPAILMGVGIISVFILVAFVVPRFGRIFEDLGQPMPLPTRIVVGVSTFLADWWWLGALSLAVGLFALRAWLRRPEGRAAWDRFVLRVPFLGPLLLRIELGRMCRTLGTLIESGVPILKGISLASEVVGNSVLRESMDEIYKGVKQGRAMSQLMRKSGVFPSLIVHLVAIGEETGRLDAMLLKVADDLDRKVTSDTKTMLALLEPATIVLMGVVIGGIIFSMLLAIFGINDVAF